MNTISPQTKYINPRDGAKWLYDHGFTTYHSTTLKIHGTRKIKGIQYHIDPYTPQPWDEHPLPANAVRFNSSIIFKTKAQLQRESNNKFTPQAFYNAIWNWIQQGCPLDNPYGFLPTVGLCSNIRGYTTWVSGTWKEKVSFQRTMLEAIQAIDGTGYPFNPPNPKRPNDKYTPYQAERDKYTNPARLAWIKKHCNPEHTTHHTS
jgi:hypothetical protein